MCVTTLAGNQCQTTSRHFTDLNNRGHCIHLMNVSHNIKKGEA